MKFSPGPSTHPDPERSRDPSLSVRLSSTSIAALSKASCTSWRVVLVVDLLDTFDDFGVFPTELAGVDACISSKFWKMFFQHKIMAPNLLKFRRELETKMAKELLADWFRNYNVCHLIHMQLGCLHPIVIPAIHHRQLLLSFNPICFAAADFIINVSTIDLNI